MPSLCCIWFEGDRKIKKRAAFYQLMRCCTCSSHHTCSIIKGVLRNFAKFTGKHLKKDTLGQVFSCEFCEISKNTFFKEHLWAAASVQGLANI